MRNIYIGVREFAIPVPRTGSIESHSGFGSLPSSPQDLHIEIQTEYSKLFPHYKSEFFLKHEFHHKEHCFKLTGRMDGIYLGEKPLIEEIKTAFNENELLAKLQRQPNHPYVLQLKTYGYIYFLQNGVLPGLQVLIVSTRNKKKRILEIPFEKEEYENWLARRFDELIEENRERDKNINRRKKLAADLVFPFQVPRPGQLELTQYLTTELAKNDQFLIQAPTGIGKTVGILFPVLKESLLRGQKSVYVTPKNSQHQVAEEAVKLFQKSNRRLRSLTIEAKSKMCFKPETLCNPEYCEFAKDHYQKLSTHKLPEKISKFKNITPSKIKRLARSYSVCPFELLLEGLEATDLVIADYNYVFAPRNILNRFSPLNLGRNKLPNLIVDEAHNLPARSRDYFSPELSTSLLKAFESKMERLEGGFETKEFQKEGKQIISQCCEAIAVHKKCTGQKIDVNHKKLSQLNDEILDFLTRYLNSDARIESGDPIIGLSRYWGGFIEALENANEAFFFTYQKDAESESLRITCCDASSLISPSYESFSKSIGFSATLKPFEYYGQLSGLDSAKLKSSEFLSSFPKKNRKLLVIPQVSTKFSDRESNYGKIASAISRIVRLKKGNYFVFFTSFDFLERVANALEFGDSVVLKQKPKMKLEDVKKVLEEIKRPGIEHLIFAVQGGVFSEGVDYPGDMMIGAIIVGPALPTHTPERQLMKAYYDKVYQSGFDYAYTYPAMSKVVQSAGRVIRSPTDRGLIVLMDRRFIEPSYSKTMPRDWFVDSVQEIVSDKIIGDIEEFWKGDLS